MFATVGDTVVASTTGDVPDALVRHLVVDWRLQTDTARDIIGDVNGMTVAADGRVWVWDNTTPALWLVHANGTTMRRIGRPGSGPGEYRSANDIAVARDGALVMWDDGNARLNIYNPDGTHRASAALSFSDCCGLPVTIDTLNRIWLTTHPRTIAGKDKPVDPAAFIASETGYLRYDASGALVDTVMPPTLPGADGRVSEEERAQLRANIEFSMRRAKSDFTWNGPEIPHEKPPIADLAVGLDGRIWVQLSVQSEAFEPDAPSRTAADRPPPVKFRPREKRWDVFEPDGRYVGRIAAPRSVSVYVRRGNQVWGVIRDESDVAAIVRMHIDPGLEGGQRVDSRIGARERCLQLTTAGEWRLLRGRMSLGRSQLNLALGRLTDLDTCMTSCLGLSKTVTMQSSKRASSVAWRWSAIQRRA